MIIIKSIKILKRQKKIYQFDLNLYLRNLYNKSLRQFAKKIYFKLICLYFN